jgi:hypothetical protein
MNKKLLFAAMSFAALTACSTDDFESQQQVAEGVSPIQFEVINNSETTRASMDGNTLKWNANHGDLFTLYHGGTLSGTALTGYDNATYKANANADGPATLSTPSMIKAGKAIMVWPVDTTFYEAASGNLTVKIPATLKNIENNIPYASDLITIVPYAAYNEKAPSDLPTAYKTAGKDRKYQIHMRPMASQLILKADYAGTDAKINALATGDDPINPIALTSVEINDPNASLTKEIDLSFATPVDPQGSNWEKVKNNAWSEVTGFNISSAVKVGQLTTECINGIESAKFLMLPQATIGASGLAGANIVVNTIYGKVSIVGGSTSTTYTAEELGDAWYRYAAAGAGAGTYTETETTTAGTGSDANKVKYTNNIEKGLAQVIDAFSTNKTTKTTSVVVGEPTGAVGTRYVKVLLTKLDMDGLHIKNDKQLYDAVRVWKEIGKGSVTVLLDGKKKEFEISQKTIAKINEINAATANEATPRTFTVMPCNTDACDIIVITGGGEMPQDLSFIQKGAKNNNKTASVALKAGENWKWNSTGKVTVDENNTGITSFINRGTLVSDATAKLQVFNNNATTPAQVYGITFVNDGKWDITAGTLNVQFDVTNNGTVNIAKGAQYRQDGSGNVFTNEATTLPERFFMNDPSKTADDKKDFKESIGKVNNSGVFATVNNANIYNYGLIEHADKDAKTYITSQRNGAGFDTPWATSNKIGRINLPYSNKDEDNISINAAASEGFVSVTVTSDNAPSDKKLDVSTVGAYVNYLIIKSGVEQITNVNNQVQYVEVNDENNTEIAWMPRFDKDSGLPIPYSYTGLIVFSDVNIKLNTIVNVSGSTYIASDMYVGGSFAEGTYDGYFGNTTKNAETMYITY